MPEDGTTGVQEQEQETQASGIVHEDIMQRLLEYQRQLREGGPPSEAAPTAEEPAPGPGEAATATTTEEVEVVDITQAEAELEEAEAHTEDAVVTVADEARPVEELFSARTPPSAPDAWVERPAATPPAPPPQDLGARVAELEATLARVSAILGELRASFQDMAIAADERLASIEEALAGIGDASPS
jgi:hypothetical protein